MEDITVAEPFPISLIHNSYLLFDISTVTYIRRVYNIVGVLIGTLPSVPQQNVFLGLPLQLMPEEARYLVENGVAYVIDEVDEHRKGFEALKREERRAYKGSLRRQGLEAARAAKRKAEGRREKALGRKAEKDKGKDEVEKHEDVVGEVAGNVVDTAIKIQEVESISTANPAMPQHRSSDDPSKDDIKEESLFEAGPPLQPQSSIRRTSTATSLPPHRMTPATSYPPLTKHRPQNSPFPPPSPFTPPSYPLYAYLSRQGYVLSPGLRFGCQYVAYPGDPLRYHSHFLCEGFGWNERIDLLNLVGGGRLGTGVKKAFLIGGKVSDNRERVERESGDGDVEVFCIEWAGM